MGTLYNCKGNVQTVPPKRNDAQGTIDSGGSVEPVASRNRHLLFPYFLKISVSPPDILTLQSGGNVQNKLEIGEILDDALLNEVDYVACTNLKCNLKGLVLRGRRGRRGDRAIRPLGES